MEKVICQVCKRQTDDANYCTHCGAALPRMDRAEQAHEMPTVTRAIEARLKYITAHPDQTCAAEFVDIIKCLQSMRTFRLRDGVSVAQRRSI